MSKVEQAVSCFKDGFSCSQAILSTYGPELGIDKTTALKVSAPFGGGMARMGETCGAVTGALMVLGLKYAAGKESKEKLYSFVTEFASRFKSRNNSISCKELLGCALNTPEGQKIFKEKNLFATSCTHYVRDAAEIIEMLIKENS